VPSKGPENSPNTEEGTRNPEMRTARSQARPPDDDEAPARVRQDADGDAVIDEADRIVRPKMT